MTLDPFALLQDAQKALDQKLKSFGDVEPAVMAVFQHLQIANRHLQQSEFAAAAAAFAQVAELAADAEQTEIQAQARYSQGGMLVALPDQQEEAIAAFQQAVDLFAQLDNTKLQRQSQQQIEQIQQRLGQDSAEVNALSTAIAEFSSETSPQQKIATYGQRGRLYVQAGQFAKAMADFDAAFAIARSSADPELIALALEQLQTPSGQDIFTAALDIFSAQVSEDPALQTILTEVRPQLEQLLNLPQELLDAVDVEGLLNLSTSLTATQTLSDTWADKLQQLESSSLLQLLTTFQAFQSIAAALEQQQFQPALELADGERQKALKASDRQRYLRFALACILMSQAYEGLGDRPAVIEVLLYGKATLEHAKGKAAGQPFLDLLNTLESRWGQDELLKARLVYREHMQRHGKYRLDI